MKQFIQQSVLAVAIFVLTCSFVEHPSVQATSTDHFTTKKYTTVGGAYLTLAGKFGGEISKKDLQGEQKLGVEGCAKGSRIFQYTLTVIKNGKKTSFEAESNLLSKTALSTLQSLSAGDEFEFKNTKAYLPNGKDVVDVHSRKFVVV